jgi:hypothetical protein
MSKADRFQQFIELCKNYKVPVKVFPKLKHVQVLDPKRLSAMLMIEDLWLFPRFGLQTKLETEQFVLLRDYDSYLDREWRKIWK